METTDLKEGQAAPAWTMTASNSEPLSLKNFKGQWVVLYFYPKDDTPGCTKEACSFRDQSALFKKKNAVVFGVSKDSTESHQKFIKKFNLPFLLLSDTDQKVCESYGVWQKKSMYGKEYFGIERSTFLISPEGKIAKIWRKVSVDGHDQDVLNAIS